MLGFVGEICHPLSFVRVDGNGVKHFWQPDRSGDYTTDTATGRAAAREMMDYIAETNSPSIFGSVIRDMISGGVYGNVEIGFCSTLGFAITVDRIQ